MMWLRSALTGFAMTVILSTHAAAEEARAGLTGPDGKPLGTVTLTQTPSGVLLNVVLKGIPAGGHGFHIHEKGSCTPDFGAAGGHYNPAGKGHGINHPMGRHAGDMPNIFAHADGTVLAEVLNPGVTLGAGWNSVFDADGSAIIVHAKPDTHGRDAGAGGRIACGVIKK